MSDERETPAVPDPGAAIEEGAASEAAVQDAVDRATGITDEGVTAEAANSPGELPGEAVGGPLPVIDAEQLHREAVSQVDTELNIEMPSGAEQTFIAEPIETPSAAATPKEVDTPVRDGEIRISADHPMAALYMQSPMPPDLKGNRGAGVLIALLATVAFAALYAGIIAAWIARDFPPSTFLSDGLLPWVTSWGFIAGVVAFFVGVVVLVMVFGRAGWWAYVIFSLLVGVLVWAASAGTFAITGIPGTDVSALVQQYGVSGSQFEKGFALMKHLGFTVPTLGAAVLAREVAVWFGAWIGARGRKVTAKNVEMMKEYEEALAEVRAKH